MPQTRRQILLAVGAALACPALSRAASRPILSHGLQSGDVTADGAILWTRSDRPARLMVEVAATPSFRDPRHLAPRDVGFVTDGMGKWLLEGMPPDSEVFWRIRAQDLNDINAVSAPLTGRFRLAPTAPRDVRFCWGGDTCGQGWGIDRDRGGLRVFRTLRARRPDFFLHSGDGIYADNPLPPTQEMPGGGVWTNLVTPEKSKVAETLHEFRHNWLYNLMDENLRAFAAEVPVIAQWDDHEVTNNWYPGEILDDPRYTVREVDVLASRARRAFFEANPVRGDRIHRHLRYGPHLDLVMLDMRSHRAANSANDQTAPGPDTAFLGPAQTGWAVEALAASRATWKIVAADMPIGLMIGDGPGRFEGVANGPGPARGREHEIAALLRGIRDRGVRNVIWLTADVHYAAAHHYSPNRAQFQEFAPFWEFVAGPLHAGTFGPGRLDDTFGPEVVFAKAPPPGQANLAPSAGLQFFGEVAIEGATGAMTVRLIDAAGIILWSRQFVPEPV